MKQKHAAIAAGLALSISLVVPAGVALADNAGTANAADAGSGSEAVASADGAAGEGDANASLPEPDDYDKSDFYQESPSVMMRNSMGLLSANPRTSIVQVSDEMKYFTRYESGRDYDKGFSKGDGYNALGYYQFDRRYAIIPFMNMCLRYDAETYAMFKPVVARGSEVTVKGASPMYSNGSLTELGKLVEDAWHAAYEADPAEFSALQDTYAYNTYYLPAESYLKGEGIDISGRADCVKGLVWSATNLFGTGGVRDFLSWANLSNDMTDEEFVTAFCDSIVNNVAKKYPSQPEYHKGWQNRYKKEKADCLAMLAAHAEEDASSGGASGGTSTPGASDQPSADGGASADEPSADGGASADEPTTDGGASSGSTSAPSSPKPSAPAPDAGSGSANSTVPPASNGVPGNGGSEGDGSTGGAGDEGAANDTGTGNGSDIESGDSDSGSGSGADTESADDSTSTGDGSNTGSESSNGDESSSGGSTEGGSGEQGDGDGGASTEQSANDGDASGDAADAGAEQRPQDKKLLPETGDTALLTVGAVAVVGAGAVGVGIALNKRGKNGSDER